MPAIAVAIMLNECASSPCKIHASIISRKESVVCPFAIQSNQNDVESDDVIVHVRHVCFKLVRLVDAVDFLPDF